MTFEFASPVYYLGDRSGAWQVPASIALLETQIDELISESVSTSSVVSKTLNLAAKIGVPGQVLGETVEVLIEADGNTITVKDGSGFVLEQVTEATGSTALPFVFTAGALALGSTPPGWLAVTVAATGSVLYSVFLEDAVEQLIEEVANTVDAEFKLVSDTGEVTLAGFETLTRIADNLRAIPSCRITAATIRSAGVANPIFPHVPNVFSSLKTTFGCVLWKSARTL